MREDEADFQVDITGGPLPQPAPVFGEFPTACGQSPRVWMCRPESVVGQKLQALWHLGMMGWRPKDLNDLCLLLTRIPMEPASLHEASGASFAELGGTGEDARALFGGASWWGMKLSAARWDDFVKSSQGHGRPGGLAVVVAEVTVRLAPPIGEARMSGIVAKAFLDNIVADIDDDNTRLVFSDWLEENGQHERAEFIRVQVERTRLPAWDAAQVGLRLREQELLELHGESWLAEMPAIKGARWEGVRRGIVAEVSFDSFEAMRINAHLCRAVAPVEAVTVHWPRRREGKLTAKPIAELRELTLTGRPFGEEITRLAESPQLSTLRVLNVLGLSVEDLRPLVASPHLSGLRALRLTSNGLGTAGVLTLTQAATLTALEELDLSGPGYYEHYYENPIINAAGMEALAGWAGLDRVRSLTLSGSDVRPAGLRALLRSPHVGALKTLSLRTRRLDGQAMSEFSNAQVGLRLEMLDLGENVIMELGAEHIAMAPCLSELKGLRLDRCEISLNGARQLAKKASFLGGLRLLEVGHNHFGPTGLEALLEREPPALHTLRMRDNNLTDTGAALLAGSPASDSLLEVDLSQNDLSVAGSLALGSSAHLGRLLVLRLSDNPIHESAIATLAASPLGRRLSALEPGSP